MGLGESEIFEEEKYGLGFRGGFEPTKAGRDGERLGFGEFEGVDQAIGEGRVSFRNLDFGFGG